MKPLLSMVMLLTAVTMSGCATSPPGHSQAPQAEVEYLTYVKAGDKAPVTQFVDTQGNNIDLAQSRNNKLLILFATWCPDSQRTMKSLAASDLHLSPNVDIIGIGREEDKAALDTFADAYALNFPLVADSDRSIYTQFANAGIPRLILLDADNNVVKTIIGEGEAPLADVEW